jgi:hypothetical protein
VENLTKRKIRQEVGAHLDPDLVESMYRRLPGWRPIFGQDGTAQIHLMNSDVGVGDLFLFFGWFRQTEITDGTYRFVRGARDLHVIFGWLQIDELLCVEEIGSNIPAWAEYHPHFHKESEGNNTVYIARDKLLLAGIPAGIAGGGTFDSYNDRLCLTAPGHTRSVWRLPKWFFPKDGRTPLTYHANMDRWTVTKDQAILQSAHRGQEFVLDIDQYPEAIEWVCSLFN